MFALAAEPLGRFVVAYEDQGGSRGFGYDLYAQFVAGLGGSGGGGDSGGGCVAGAAASPLLALAGLLVALTRRR